MSQSSQIEDALHDSLGDQLISLEWSGNAYQLIIASEERILNVTWPYPLQETYFDFRENGEKVFSHFIEMYDGETQDEMIEHIDYVANRFLNMEIRIETSGQKVKETTLEVFDGENWKNIFE